MSKFLTVQKSLAFGGLVDLLELRAGLQAAGINSDSLSDMGAVGTLVLRVDDTVEQAAVEAVLANHDALRPKRYAEIDARTAELIAQGFEWPASSGGLMSLSISAQMKLEAMRNAADALAYPVVLSRKSAKSSEYNVADATELRAIADAGALHVAAVVDAGAKLKAAIRAATTLSEVNAVVDER